MIEKVKAGVETAVRIERLKNKARWLGWRLVECPEETWAAVYLKREDIRFPDSGGVQLSDMAYFLSVRENDPVF